jgi:hypothetical protein
MGPGIAPAFTRFSAQRANHSPLHPRESWNGRPVGPDGMLWDRPASRAYDPGWGNGWPVGAGPTRIAHTPGRAGGPTGFGPERNNGRWSAPRQRLIGPTGRAFPQPSPSGWDTPRPPKRFLAQRANHSPRRPYGSWNGRPVGPDGMVWDCHASRAFDPGWGNGWPVGPVGGPFGLGNCAPHTHRAVRPNGMWTGRQQRPVERLATTINRPNGPAIPPAQPTGLGHAPPTKTFSGPTGQPFPPRGLWNGRPVGPDEIVGGSPDLQGLRPWLGEWLALWAGWRPVGGGQTRIAHTRPGAPTGPEPPPS